jgi:hypothetical protein
MAVEFSKGLAPLGIQSETVHAQKWCQLLYNQNVAAGTPMTGADKFSDGLEPGPMNSYEVVLCKINQLYYNRTI